MTPKTEVEMLEDLKLIEYDSVGSTNAEARAYAANTDERSAVLFVARSQSAGRGRLGRSFLSRNGRGIYMSLLYFTCGPLCDAVSVTTAAAVFTARAIERATGKRMLIKWVNDIYNDRGKVAGILTETMPVEEYNAVIVGIGINIGDDDFPCELRGVAASIGEIDEEQKKMMIGSVAGDLIGFFEDPTDRGYMSDYRERFMLDGAQVDLLRAGEVTAHGRVLGVCDDGGLILLPDGETEPVIIHTGEVSVRNIKR